MARVLQLSLTALLLLLPAVRARSLPLQLYCASTWRTSDFWGLSQASPRLAFLPTVLPRPWTLSTYTPELLRNFQIY